jgi:histidine triad (HIT) family protein
VFCDIVEGRAPATIVASDPLTVAFFDQRQFHPGHVLVVPRAHIADVRDADADVGSALMTSVGRIARGVAGVFPNEGLSVWHSIGAAADQEVPHLHFHVHPRRVHDGLLRVYPSAPAYPERTTLDEWGARLRAVLAVLVLLWAVPAAAQPSQRYEASVHVAAASLPQFEGSDFGVGGRLAWRADDLLTFEAELTLFPGDYPDVPLPFSQRRIEGLFGVTAGLRFGRLRPFAKFRAGFVDLQEASGPVACILIFPPPLSCALAAGPTLPAFDVGGGVEVDVTPRAFVRIEAGDRMLKYSGPAIGGDGVPRAEDFWGHGLRFAAGVGVRF